MKTNIIKRTITILALTLGFAGGVVADTYTLPTLATNGIEKNIYLDIKENTIVAWEPTSVACTLDMTSVLSDFKTANSSTTAPTQSDLEKSFYVRWYMLDKDGAVEMPCNTNNANLLIKFYKDDWNNRCPYYYGTDNTSNYDSDNFTACYSDGFYRGYTGKIADKDKDVLEKAFKAFYYANNTLVHRTSGRTVVCEITDKFDATKISTTNTDANYLKSSEEETAGFFKLRYIFHFDEEPNTFLNDKNSEDAVTSKALSTSYELKDDSTDDVFCYSSTDNKVTVNLSKDAKVAAAGITNAAKYIRWYAVDAAGKQIEMPSCVTLPQGGTVQSNPKNGTIYYNLTNATPLDGITVSGTLAEISAVHLVCVASKDASDITVSSATNGGTSRANDLSEGTVTQEPTWDMQYFINFEAPFKGDATNATKHNHSFTLAETYWTTLSDNPNVQFEMSNGSNQIKFTYKVGWTESNLTATSNFLTDNKFTSSTLSNDQHFYVRWFLRNKTTQAEYYVNGLLSNVDNSGVTFTDDGRHVYWYSGLDTNNKDLNKIMQVKIDKSKVTNLSDYELVADISTEDADKYKNSDNSLLTHEPDKITAEYVLSFVGRGFEDAKAISQLTPEKRTAIVRDDGTVLLQLYDEEKELIEKELPNINTTHYARWFIEDKDGKKVSSDVTGIGSAGAQTFVKDDKYGYYTSNSFFLSDAKASVLDLRINYDGSVSTGITLLGDVLSNYADYKLVILLSDKSDGQKDANFNTVYVEPTIVKKYEYVLLKEDDIPFVHYNGITGRPWTSYKGSDKLASYSSKAYFGEKNEVSDFTVSQWHEANITTEKRDVRQNASTWEYDYYVEPGKTVDLVLPLDKVENGGSNLEPQGYYRWYNWTTDYGSNNIAAITNDTKTSLLSQKFKEKNGDTGDCYRGLFAWNFRDNPKKENVAAVKYTAPATGWTGETIACDVSKYTDGQYEVKGTSNQYQANGILYYLLHEPTLSTRYIYRVHPASELADDIAAKMQKGKFFEDNGYYTMGIMVDTSNGTLYKGTSSLRLNLNAVERYYFHPCTATYSSGGKVSYSFNNSKTVQASKVKWRVFTKDRTKVMEVDKGTSRFFDIDLNGQNATNFNNKYVETSTLGSSTIGAGTVDVKFTPGSVAYVEAWVYDENGNCCPVATYTVRFLADEYPIKESNGLPTERTIDYLTNNMTLVAHESFDDLEDTESVGLSVPTTAKENMAPMPLPFAETHYGYTYMSLYDHMGYNARYTGGVNGANPQHGEYTLVKTMNKETVSKSGSTSTDGIIHTWWYSQKEVDDCTYATTNGEKYGYFLYIDASDESRPICRIPFEGDMCEGSTLAFTMDVADVTNAQIHPQILFKLYGVDMDGEGNITDYSLIHSFSSGDMFSYYGNDLSAGEWYQVYGKIHLQAGTGVENYHQFIISVDNFCPGTEGADYAIDDMRIYVDNAKIDVQQEKASCSNEPVKMTLRLKHSALKAVVDDVNTAHKMFYRICDSDGTLISNVNIYDKDTDGKILHQYATIDVPAYDIDDDITTVAPTYDDSGNLTKSGFVKDEDGVVYFVFAKNNFTYTDENGKQKALEAGKNYYISVARLEATSYTSEPVGWGEPKDICSIYSKVFTPLKQSMSLYDGTALVDGYIDFGCRTSENETPTKEVTLKGKLKIPDSTTNSFMETDFVKFKWTVYKKEEYAKRDAEGKITGTAETVTTKDNESQSTVTLTLGETYIIIGEPQDSKVTIDGTEYDVCSDPIEMEVKGRIGGPAVYLGFPEVDYPSSMPNCAEVVRLGLCQINDMRKNEKLLYIPIHHYNDKTNTDGKRVVGNGVQLNADMILSGTNDPLYQDKIGTAVAAKLMIDKLPLDASKADDDQFLRVDFYTPTMSSSNGADANSYFAFHEGYEYELNFTYNDGADDIENTMCEGETFFTLKIVPEYVTWTGRELNNTNWLNDRNWSRSVREDLYKKSATGTADTDFSEITKLSTNTDGYENNGEGTLTGLETRFNQQQSYVPMKFTKVTILPYVETETGIGNDITKAKTYVHAPYLAELSYDMHSGIMKRTSNADLSPATTNIEYDIMVRMEDDDDNPTNAYGCEKFYGNECYQIYFKPESELRYQHYLNYNKAWVEKKFKMNAWSLFSSPFQKMYAGDMYVPSTWMQTTEAFQPITFTNKTAGSDKTQPTDAITYSRTKQPFYQRSWDKTDASIMVLPSDSKEEKLNGNITYSTWGDVSVVQSNWSHAYNDVEELYETARGIAIKPNKTSNGDDDYTLVRLPKADTEYTYYYYDDETSKGGSVKKSQTLDRAAAGKLNGSLVENAAATVDDTGISSYSTTGTVTGIISVTPQVNATETNGLYLVGNPYMATLSMTRFFARNTQLARKFWYIENGQMYAYSIDDAALSTEQKRVKPMQAFFVKLAEGSSELGTIQFRPEMTVDNRITSVNTVSVFNSRSRASLDAITDTSDDTSEEMTMTRALISQSSLTLTATNTAGRSTAEVKVSDTADADFVDSEDVEMLYDSNLADLPMLYTVAGTKAVSLNALPEVKMLPLGIVSSTTTDATLTITGSDSFNSKVYLYDSKTKKSTELTEPTTVTIAANAHGRYYLTSVLPEQIEETDQSGIHCYSPQPGVLVVSSPMDELQQVDVYGIDGTLIKRLTPAGVTSVTETLSRNIYIVKVRTAANAKTIKIRVN